MRLFSRLFSIAFAALLLPLGSLIAAAVTVVIDAVPPCQPGAAETLALDRLTRPVANLPTVRSRFMAFIARLDLHDLFNGAAFRFDPGRVLMF